MYFCCISVTTAINQPPRFGIVSAVMTRPHYQALITTMITLRIGRCAWAVAGVGVYSGVFQGIFPGCAAFVSGVPKSRVAPPWKKAFSLMRVMRCLRISLVCGKKIFCFLFHFCSEPARSFTESVSALLTLLSPSLDINHWLSNGIRPFPYAGSLLLV